MISSRGPLRRSMVVVLMLLSLVAILPLRASAQGTSDAAHACQQGGWAQLRGANGERFENEGECVAYAAQGGSFAPPLSPVIVATASPVWYASGFYTGPGYTISVEGSGFTPGGKVCLLVDTQQGHYTIDCAIVDPVSGGFGPVTIGSVKPCYGLTNTTEAIVTATDGETLIQVSVTVAVPC